MGEGRAVGTWRRGRGRHVDKGSGHVDRQTDGGRATRTEKREREGQKEGERGREHLGTERARQQALYIQPHLRHLMAHDDIIPC